MCSEIQFGRAKACSNRRRLLPYLAGAHHTAGLLGPSPGFLGPHPGFLGPLPAAIQGVLRQWLARLTEAYPMSPVRKHRGGFRATWGVRL